MKEKIIEEIIHSNHSPVNVEYLFCDFLDETYSFKEVGGPFEHMTPSSVLREMDPTWYRTGIADYEDDLVENQDYLRLGDDIFHPSAKEEYEELVDKLANVEVYYLGKDKVIEKLTGWYYSHCLEDEKAIGPFSTEEEAWQKAANE
jgi:hypothetical protein